MEAKSQQNWNSREGSEFNPWRHDFTMGVPIKWQAINDKVREV